MQSGWRWAVEVVGSLLFTSMVNRGTTMTHAFRRHVRLDDPIWIGGILLTLSNFLRNSKINA